MDDVLVVGAGAVGLSTALHAARLGHRVRVVEKEPGPARHQSGRNSGVIHAGYNLKPGSAKARYCTEGSRALRAYCADQGVPVIENGILVVAQDDADEATLKELHRRAQANGVAASLVDGAAMHAIEPHAAGSMALHAPEGASFDAQAYAAALAADAQQAGVTIEWRRRVRSIREGEVKTDRGPRRAKVVVNAAGLHADRLARAQDLRVIPFRGTYAELAPARSDLVRAHIYAAPDLTFPFLGVHLSRRTDGRVLVGPGAMLAFGREAYAWRIQPRDLADTLAWPGFWRLLARPDVRRLIRHELAKSLRVEAVRREAARLVPALARGDLRHARAGNRAQLVGRDGRLVDDILVRTTDRAVHVLNAVSPGLTCSLPFGAHLADLAHARC